MERLAVLRPLYLIQIVILALLSSCSSHPPLPGLITAVQPSKQLLEEGKKYGAFYIHDEMRIKAIYNPLDYQFTTTYTINKRIKIISREGMRFATITPGHFNGALKSFRLKVYAPDGKEKSIDVDMVKNKYRETGQIVVPQAEVGCEILLIVQVVSDKSMDNYEHFYSQNIPSAQSRFTFLYSSDFKYRYKSYGLKNAVMPLVSGPFRGFMISEGPVLPTGNFHHHGEYPALLQKRAPSHQIRTMVSMQSFKSSWTTYNAPDWSSIAKRFHFLYLTPSFFSSTGHLDHIVENTIYSGDTLFDQADSILAYVQDNYTLNKNRLPQHGTIDLNRVIREKNGNQIELSVLLHELYAAAGFSANYFITRFIPDGGFDPDFPSWQQLHIPLISVLIDKREYIAFPYFKQCKLGEYPLELVGSQGLNLKTGSAGELPVSPHTKAGIISKVAVSPIDIDQRQYWDFTFSDGLAVLMRFALGELNKSSLKHFSENLLHAYSENHEVLSSVIISNSRGGDITLRIGFINKNVGVDGPDGKYLSLGPFFLSGFNHEVDDESTGYHNPISSAIEEKVILQDTTPEQISLDFRCENFENAMFEVKCISQATDNGYVIGRKILLKKGNFATTKYKEFKPDTIKLNRITGSSLTIKE